MKYILTLLFLVTSFSYGQKKATYNREHVVFPGCENAEDLAKCYETNLLQFIDSSLTKEITQKIIKYSKKDTIKIYSRLYFDEKGAIIKKHSGFSSSADSTKNQLDYLITKFPKVGPVLDQYNNGVADYKNSMFGFQVDRKNNTLVSIKDYQPEEVPYSIIENVPRYKGCPAILSNEIAKKCMSAKVSKHVSSHFNGNLASSLDLSPGIKKIYVFFKINKEGKVTSIKARAPHPALEKEAIRVISLIPDLDAPGMQRGKPATVPYSLPITFSIEETAAQKRERKRLKRKQRH
ncbi:energy transducer TonB [Olleya sp. R77988]|uniref:energy transducer TonB n=1 Tax=Olleya sp. R77988 TaxID=3093875 RepID=UPI0037C8B05E